MDTIINLTPETKLTPETMSDEEALTIISNMIRIGAFSEEVITALDIASTYLRNGIVKKSRLGDDLLVEVLKNYEVDKNGNIVKKKWEK